MADAIDAILGGGSGDRDEIDDILGGAPAPKPAARPAAPAGIAGLTMKRQPKSFSASDVDIGIESEPVKPSRVTLPGLGTIGYEQNAPQAPSAREVRNIYGPPGEPLKPQTELEGDPIAQAIAAAALLRLPAVPTKALLAPRLGPLAAPLGAGAEGALATGMMGGDLR